MLKAALLCGLRRFCMTCTVFRTTWPVSCVTATVLCVACNMSCASTTAFCVKYDVGYATSGGAGQDCARGAGHAQGGRHAPAAVSGQPNITPMVSKLLQHTNAFRGCTLRHAQNKHRYSSPHNHWGQQQRKTKVVYWPRTIRCNSLLYCARATPTADSAISQSRVRARERARVEGEQQLYLLLYFISADSVVSHNLPRANHLRVAHPAF